MSIFLKQAAVTLAWILGICLVLNILGIGFSTFDYGWKCTKCLRDSHVVERRLFGFTYWKTSSLRFAGHDMAFLGESPCAHVFRKGGFGNSQGGLFWDSIGCGVTREGSLFRFRWDALSSAFDLNTRLHEEALLKETFQIVNSLLPPDTTSYDKRDGDGQVPSVLLLLAMKLGEAQDRDAWEEALAEAKTGQR